MAKDHPANARQEIDKNPEFYYFSNLFFCHAHVIATTIKNILRGSRSVF